MAAPSFASSEYVASGSSATTVDLAVVELTAAGADFTANNKHLVFAHSKCKADNPADRASMYLYVDGARYVQNVEEVKSQHDGGGSAPDWSVDLDYWGIISPATDVGIYIDNIGGGGSMTYSDFHIIMVDINDLVDGTDYVTADVNNVALLGTTYVTYETITFTPNESGEKWLVWAGFTHDGEDSVNNYEVRLLDPTDASVREFSYFAGPGASNTVTKGMWYVYTAVGSSAVTFEFQAKRDASGGGSRLESSYMIAIRLDSLSGNYQIDAQSDYAITAADTIEDTGWDTVLTPSDDGNIILLAQCEIANPGDDFGGTIWPNVGAATVPATFVTTAATVGGYFEALNAIDDPQFSYVGVDPGRALSETTYDWDTLASATDTLGTVTTLAMEITGGAGYTPPAAGGYAFDNLVGPGRLLKTG